MKTREDILNLIEKNSICAEIGVFAGDFSELIFNTIKPSKLFLVDLFTGNAASGDKNGNNIREISLDGSYNYLQQKYINTPSVSLFKGRSEDFLKALPDDYLDFIYIDGDHSYEGCKTDLELARHKVKPNGVISGHDYCDRFKGVMQAVDEFVTTNKIEALITPVDICASFFIKNIK